MAPAMPVDVPATARHAKCTRLSAPSVGMKRKFHSCPPRTALSIAVPASTRCVCLAAKPQLLSEDACPGSGSCPFREPRARAWEEVGFSSHGFFVTLYSSLHWPLRKASSKRQYRRRQSPEPTPNPQFERITTARLSFLTMPVKERYPPVAPLCQCIRDSSSRFEKRNKS